jgi:hypothetical protein
MKYINNSDGNYSLPDCLDWLEAMPARKRKKIQTWNIPNL